MEGYIIIFILIIISLIALGLFGSDFKRLIDSQKKSKEQPTLYVVFEFYESEYFIDDMHNEYPTSIFFTGNAFNEVNDYLKQKYNVWLCDYPDDIKSSLYAKKSFRRTLISDGINLNIKVEFY